MAETSSIEVKGYIPLDFDDAILQKHLSTQHVVGSYLGKAHLGGKRKKKALEEIQFLVEGKV